LRTKLTARFVNGAQAAPGDERTLYFDEDLRCFALMVTRSGHRRFVLQYRLHGRSRRLTLKDGLTLKGARQEARKLLGEVARGHDPLDERRKKEMASVNTVAAIAAEYFKRDGKKLRSANWQQVALTRLVFSRFGARQIGSIKRSEIVRLLDQIEDDNGPVMADAVLAILRKLFGWHASRSDDFNSPIVRGIRKQHSRARDRVLSDHELRQIWRATEPPTVFNALVRYLLLTATRRTEAARMTRAEISNGDWIIPAPRMKAGIEHVVPLSRDAKALLAELPVIGTGEFVFTNDGQRPVGDFVKPRRDLDRRSGVSGWRLHDLRRTARSLLSRGGVTPDVAERCLAHAIGGVRATYDRHSYHAEKKHAFEVLAAQIRLIVVPQAGNVVPMSGDA
jgi:integrase